MAQDPQESKKNQNPEELDSATKLAQATEYITLLEAEAKSAKETIANLEAVTAENSTIIKGLEDQWEANKKTISELQTELATPRPANLDEATSNDLSGLEFEDVFVDDGQTKLNERIAKFVSSDRLVVAREVELIGASGFTPATFKHMGDAVGTAVHDMLEHDEYVTNTLQSAFQGAGHCPVVTTFMVVKCGAPIQTPD